MAEEQGNRIKEFLQSARGRQVIIASLAGALFLILLVVVFLIYSKGTKPSQQATATKTTTSSATSQVTTETPSDGEAPIEDDFSESYEVYEIRDPFKPLSVSTTAASTTSTASATGAAASSSTTSTASPGGSESTSTVSSTSQPLALENIFTRDGVLLAQIKYGSNVYELKSGDRVGDSPFQLTQIGSDSVTLLYGDDQIVLRKGEEIYK